MDPDSRWHKGLLVGLIGLVLALIVQQPLVYSAPTELQPFVLSSQANLGTACLVVDFITPHVIHHPQTLFGKSVAIEGSTIVVGMPGHSRPDEELFYTGAVYVYERQPDGTLQQQTFLEPNEPVKYGFFGSQVAITGDTIFVSAPKSQGDNEDMPNAGQVYVYQRQPDTTWKQQAILRPSVIGAYHHFGNAMAADGDTLVVAAYGEAGYTGAIYVFTHQSDGTWLETDRIIGSKRSFNQRFGTSLDIDGQVFIVGASGKKSFEGAPIDSGAAHIFEQQPDGTWLEKTIVYSTVSDLSDRFGESVAVSGDRIAVAIPFDDGNENTLKDSGSVVMYQRNADGFWVYEQTLQATDAEIDDVFGLEIALEGDMLLVSTPYKKGPADMIYNSGAGAVYMFTRQNLGWSQQAKHYSPTPDAGENFGSMLTFDGSMFMIGAIGNDDVGNDAGAVYRYQIDSLPQIEVVAAQFVATNAPVQLTASVPHLNGSDVTYAWKQISGPEVVLSDATASTLAFTAPDDPSTLTFEVFVTNGCGITATETLSITVENQLPVADAGPTQQVLGRSLVTLDATASYDPDNDALGYEWIQLEGSTVVLSDASSMKPSFTAPNETTSLTFQLTVTDEFAGTSVTTTTVNIEQSRNIFLPFLARER